MVEEKSWKEFRDSGLLWFINNTLHLFGWALVVEVDEGEVTRCYPARVKFRGFDEKSNTEGYIKVSDYLYKNSTQLLAESKE